MEVSSSDSLTDSNILLRRLPLADNGEGAGRSSTIEEFGEVSVRELKADFTRWARGEGPGDGVPALEIAALPLDPMTDGAGADPEGVVSLLTRPL